MPRYVPLGLAIVIAIVIDAGICSAQTSRSPEPEVLGRSLGPTDSRFRPFGEGDFAGQYYLYADGERMGRMVEPCVTFLAELAEEPGEGRYRVTWADEAFGEAAPFRLDFANADAIRERVVESLREREAGQLSASDPAIANIWA